MGLLLNEIRHSPLLWMLVFVPIVLAAEKAAQYAASNAELEARVRVLEKIVTDGGLETAAQIEALRTPRLEKGDKVQ